MQQVNPSYWQVLESFPGLDLPDLFKQLEPNQAIELTYCLLAGNDPFVINWLRTITHPVKFRFNSPRDLAIDLFKENDVEWFKEREGIFEQIYLKILSQKKGGIQSDTLDVLKGLIHSVGAGIGFHFFQKTLKKRGLSPIEETDLFLLWIKLYGIDKFEEIELAFDGIKLDLNQYLIPVSLCLYEKKDPIRGLKSLIFLDTKYYEQKYNTLEEDWFRKYLSVYVKKSLSSLLQDKRFLNYANLKYLIRDVIKQDWLCELINESLNDPSLEELAKQFYAFEKGDNSGLITYTTAEDVDHMILQD